MTPRCQRPHSPRARGRSFLRPGRAFSARRARPAGAATAAAPAATAATATPGRWGDIRRVRRVGRGGGIARRRDIWRSRRARGGCGIARRGGKWRIEGWGWSRVARSAGEGGRLRRRGRGWGDRNGRRREVGGAEGCVQVTERRLERPGRAVQGEEDQAAGLASEAAREDRAAPVFACGRRGLESEVCGVLGVGGRAIAG